MTQRSWAFACGHQGLRLGVVAVGLDIAWLAALETRGEALGSSGPFPFQSCTCLQPGISIHEPGISGAMSGPPGGQGPLEYGSFSTGQVLHHFFA